MLRRSSISIIFIFVWLKLTRLLLIWICQLLKLLLQMFRLIILGCTRISWLNWILSIAKALVVRTTNSNCRTTVTRSGVLVLIKSYAFLFYYLRLFLILNVQILILLRNFAFLAVADIFLKHIIYISHIIRINLLVITRFNLASQSTKTTKWSRWMWGLVMNTVVGNCVGSFCCRLYR